MPLSNFTRPAIPYANAPLPNDNRFNIITRVLKKPITTDQLDGEFNKITDNCNILDNKIEDIQVGIISGSDNPLNAGKFLTTDGAEDPTLSYVNVTGANIDDGAIPGVKITPLTIGTEQLDNGIITPDKVPNNSMPYSKMDFDEEDIPYVVINVPDGAIPGQKIIGKSITQAQQGLLSVGSPELIDDAVIESKIADNAVTTLKIPDNAITTPKIPDNAITTEKVNDQAITLPKIALGVIKSAATKADQIAGNSDTVYTSPEVQQHHPSATKFWCIFNGTTPGTNPPLAGYNVVSVIRLQGGLYQINFTVPFTTNNYCITISASQTGSPAYPLIKINSLSVGSCQIETSNSNGGMGECAITCVVGYGLQ